MRLSLPGWKPRRLWPVAACCAAAAAAIAQSERPVVESTGPVKITRQVEYAFRVDPMVHRLEARRGEVLPVAYQIIAKDLPTTVIVKTVALRQQDNGVIMPDEEAPPPAPLIIDNPGQYDIDPGQTIDILGQVRLPPGSDANFHSYGLLVKDIGRQLQPQAGAAGNDQPRAAIKFVTQYLCRADIRVLGVRGESLAKLRMESGELREHEGRPMVRVWVQNPTDAALEYQMRCRIGSPEVGARRPAFPLVMPIRATVEGPERVIARILPGSRLRMEDMVPFPVFPGEYVLDVDLLDGARVVSTAQFQLSVGEHQFPAQDATVIQLAGGVTVTPAQIELSLRGGGDRFVAATFTNETSQTLDLQLAPQGLGNREFDWLSIRPNILRLGPGKSRRALVSLGPNRDDQTHRYAALGARVVNEQGEVLGERPLTVALVGRSEEGAKLEVAKIRWDPTGDQPAFVVPVTNTGALHLPLRGQMVLTEEGGKPEEVYAGHGRWLLPGASDELRFPLQTALKAGLFELKLNIESGDPAAPFTFSEVLQLTE
jgi:hypothetical protein